MSNTKRRVFTFDESDLEWINPMLLEWEKESEGKNGAALITKLMKDYRETQGPTKLEMFTQKIKSDYNRAKTSLASSTATLRTRMAKIFRETKVKFNHIASRIAAAPKKALDSIHSQLESRKK